jgi:hypothetical protein
MVSPTQISATIGDAWPVGMKFNWTMTENGHEIYYPQGHSYGSSIKVNRLTNVWSDNGSEHPTVVVEETIDGVVHVALYWNNPQQLLSKFPKPTVADWIVPPPPPEEPATGTEGINPNEFLSASLTYDFATNRLSWILPASYSSTSDPLITAHRTDYLLDNDTLWLPATPGYTTYIIHTQGTPSIGNSTNDISPGQWSIRRKISAPSGSTGVVAQLSFTQIEVDAYNAAVAAQAAADAAAAAQAAADAAAAAQAAADAAAAAQASADAAAAAQAAADAAAAGSNAPPNTPRGRRGNHNFW